MKRAPAQLELPIAPADDEPDDFAAWITQIRDRNLADIHANPNSTLAQRLHDHATAA